MKKKSASGFTLIETLISVLLSGIALIFISAVWTSSLQLNKTLELQSDAEKDKWSAEAQIRLAFIQAVDLTYVDSQDLASWSGLTNNFTGALRSFDSDSVWTSTVAQVTYPLALFYRDEGRSRVNAPTAGLKSEFFRTGLYFQKPTFHKWGALYLSLGEQGPGSITPLNGAKFEGLVRVQIKNVRIYNPAGTTSPGAFSIVPVTPKPVTSFDLEMTFRKYLGPEGSETWVYCPEAVVNTIPQCKTKTPFHDVVRTLRIVTRNNVLALSPAAKLPAPPAPAVGVEFGARVYDRIHFFKPSFAGGVL